MAGKQDDLKDLVRSEIEFLKNRLNCTQEELSVQLGYGKTYLSEVFTPTGKVSPKLLKALERFRSTLENPSIQLPARIAALRAAVHVLTEQIADLKLKAGLGSSRKQILEELEKKMQSLTQLLLDE